MQIGLVRTARHGFLADPDGGSKLIAVPQEPCQLQQLIHIEIRLLRGIQQYRRGLLRFAGVTQQECEGE